MLLAQCSTTTYKYAPNQKNKYTFSNGRQTIVSDLEPLYYDLEWHKPIGLTLYFSQNLPRAENLKSIEIKLFSKENNSAGFTKELICESSQLVVEYWNGKDRTEITKDNFKGDFGSLIDPSMKDYRFRESTVAGFKLENKYAGDHPETLSQQIIIRWLDKPEETFTNTLTKEEHTKSFISGRPFG